MKSQKYWNERSTALNENLLALGDEFSRKLALEYEKSHGRIQKEIEAFYEQFGKDNKISFADAKKILTTSEKRRFMLEVDDYIEKASQFPYSPEWDLMLKNASNAHRVTRLQALQIQMEQQIEELYSKYHGGMEGIVSKAYSEGYYRSIYDIQQSEGYGSPFATLDTETIKKLIAKPWSPDGSNFSDKIWKNRDELVNYLEKELTQAFIRGEGSSRLIKEIQKKFGASSKNAARLVQTEMSFFATAAKLESYKAMGYEKYIIDAIMDGKTSAICKEMDNQVFDIEDYAPGVTAPPFHPWCRTSISPYAGDVEANKVYRDDNGVYIVPRDMSFEQWLKEHVGENGDTPSEIIDSIADDIDLFDDEDDLFDDEFEENENYYETIDMNDLDKKLSEYENSIIDQDYESCYVILPDGRVYRFDGEEFGVIPEGIDFTDAVILHNHPIDEEGLVDSFSRDDIDFIKRTPEAGEYYLVGGEYEYWLKVLKEIDLIWPEMYNGSMELARIHSDADSPQHFMMEFLKSKGYVDYVRKLFNRRPKE